MSKFELPRRKFVLGTAAATAALSMPGILRAQGSDPIKIAVVSEQSGLFARTGTMVKIGAVMAVEDINKSGGIKALGGRKLELVIEDAGELG